VPGMASQTRLYVGKLSAEASARARCLPLLHKQPSCCRRRLYIAVKHSSRRLLLHIQSHPLLYAKSSAPGHLQRLMRANLRFKSTVNPAPMPVQED